MLQEDDESCASPSTYRSEHHVNLYCYYHTVLAALTMTGIALVVLLCVGLVADR